ncbi:MAG: OmpA family protein [Phycisphaerae bacterium]|nr:OmpA family protein [Gemmatimonadaceae bacterium]
MASPRGGKKIIIVKKKITGGGGHHGGSWKVAYADFVTAMMAFFMVMWILGMDDKTKMAIEGYFANPVGYKKGYGSGSSALFAGSSPTTIQRPSLKTVVRTQETRTFEELRGRIEAKLQANDSLKALKTLVEVTVTNEGLRIELIESDKGDQYFALGSAVMKPATTMVLEIVGSELALLQNPIILEGHTDAAKFDPEASYTNWELSSDRANAARRVFMSIGIGDKRLAEVRAYADTKLRVPNDPTAAANRRISIMLPFSSNVPDGDGTAEGVANVVKDSILRGFIKKKP